MQRVFLAMPTYDARCFAATAMAIAEASRDPALEIQRRAPMGSVLPSVFNMAWLEATENDFDYFAMIHADVWAQPGWLDRMIQILDETGSDLVSAVLRIKTHERLTSTGVDRRGQPTVNLTVADIEKLPAVFGEDDVRELYADATTVLHNTGLFVARMCSPWVKEWRGFTMASTILREPKGARVVQNSEDWLMARDMAAMTPRPKVRIVSALRTLHYGTAFWSSPQSSSVAPATVH